MPTSPPTPAEAVTIMFTERFTDVITDLGSFELPIDPNRAPLDASLEKVKANDYLVLLPTWFQHPEAFLDSDLLAMARYVGKIIEPERSLEAHQLIGQGIALEAGDQELGPRYSFGFAFNNAAPSAVLDNATGLLSIGAIVAGTVTDTSVDGYGNGTANIHRSQSVREALDIYLRTVNGHARINYNGTLDMCLSTRDDVYRVTNPMMVATRYGWGWDPSGYIGVHCNRMLKRLDVRRTATSARYIDSVTKATIAGTSIDYGFQDLRGDALERVLLVESLPTGINAFGYLSNELKLRGAAIEVEIQADTIENIFRNMTGDNIFIFSPEDGLMDITNEINFRGQKMWPIFAQITETRTPYADWQGVYVRHQGTDPAGPAAWTDITKAAVPEYQEGRSFSTLVVKAKLAGLPGCD